jgi:hypothetical protein
MAISFALATKFIDAVVKLHPDLSVAELQSIWSDVFSSAADQTTSASALKEMSVDKLKELCKQRGLKNYSKKTKAAIVELLTGAKAEESPSTTTSKTKPSKKKSDTSEETKVTKPTKTSSSKKASNVLDKIKSKTSVALVKNKHDQTWHEQTGFVFDESRMVVIGKIDTSDISDAKRVILQLSTSDIQKCNELKFKYDLPEALVSDVAHLESEVLADVVVEDDVEDAEAEEDADDDGAGDELEADFDV